MFELSTITHSLFAFILLFILQIVLSRIFRCWSEDKFIIGLYVAFPFVVFCALFFLDFMGLVAAPKAVATYILFFAISSSWVASYPAIYAVCPTLVISVYIRARKGTTVEELQSLLNLRQNSVDRINDAVHDNLLKVEGSSISLTTAGRVFAIFFIFYRRILGLGTDTL